MQKCRYCVQSYVNIWLNCQPKAVKDRVGIDMSQESFPPLQSSEYLGWCRSPKLNGTEERVTMTSEISSLNRNILFCIFRELPNRKTFFRFPKSLCLSNFFKAPRIYE